MSHILRSGLARLETTTRVTLAVLALASGVYTYLGVRGLLNGTAEIVFYGAVIYSTAVSVGIYAFWSYLMRLLPHVRSDASRRVLWFATVLGSLMIVAMSSWLNAAALAGGAALEQHLANAIEDYQQSLDTANNNALAAQSLLPDITLATQRFAGLADEERRSGALTGTSGSGTVVQLLTQMSSQLENLAKQVDESRSQVRSLYEQGGRHLAQMRKLVSAPGPIEARSDAFGEEAVALSGVIAALQQSSIAPAVKRTADDLARTFIAPVAGGGSADLASRQTEVVGRVEQSVRAQAGALSEAADEILARPAARVIRFTPLSTPEAVLRYAGDFLPSWAGAISIDLMPAVLILILCGVHSAIRREEGNELEGNTFTAQDMLRAMQLYSQIQAHGVAQISSPVPLARPEPVGGDLAAPVGRDEADPARGPAAGAEVPTGRARLAAPSSDDVEALPSASEHGNVAALKTPAGRPA
ncbi:MAG: hypothetical protein GC150_10330 [Rhizobiales bacterium]|nr:hypothetical protein [Hyphomicrobiales bacterium]